MAKRKMMRMKKVGLALDFVVLVAANTSAPWTVRSRDAKAMVYRSVGRIAFSTVAGGELGQMPAALSS
jgi:hypothetical protein